MAVDIDTVRILIGDEVVVGCEPLIGDDSIEALAALVGENTYAVAIAAAKAIAAKFARMVDTTTSLNNTTVKNSQKHKQYMDLAKQLERDAAKMGSTGVYAGGISLADKATREADDDRVQPIFTRDLHSNP